MGQYDTAPNSLPHHISQAVLTLPFASVSGLKVIFAYFQSVLLDLHKHFRHMYLIYIFHTSFILKGFTRPGAMARQPHWRTARGFDIGGEHPTHQPQEPQSQPDFNNGDQCEY
jgi:hypothetical protein